MKADKRKYLLRNSLLILILILSLLLLILVLVLSIYVLISGEGSEFDNVESKTFKFYQFDPETNKSVSGFVSVMRDFGDFQSYRRNDGSYVLIAPFGSMNYQCTGSCFCSEEVEMRSRSASVFPLVRGLFILVAASTSVFAIESARVQLLNDCKSQIDESTCPPHAIKAEVENCNVCENIVGESYEGDELEMEKRRFLCRGKCMPRDWMREGFLQPPTLPKRFTVKEELERERVIKVLKRESDEFGCNQLSMQEILDGHKFFVDPEIVAQVFVDSTLKHYCRDNSFIGFERMDVESLVADKHISGYFSGADDGFFEIPVCKEAINNYNPSVECVELYHDQMF